MKKSTIIYLIIGIILLIIFTSLKIILVLISIPLFFYLMACFLEIYIPYNLKYSNEHFGVLKPKHNIIYKLSNLIDGKSKTI